MRILQFIETGGPGGAETVFSQLSSGLEQRGHEIVCITGRGNWLPDEIKRRGLTHHIRHYGTRFDIGLLKQLMKRFREDKIDLAHAHLFDAATYASLAAKLSGIPCVVTLHGQVDVRRNSTTTKVKAAILRRCAQRVVAVSSALRDDLRDVLRIPSNNFRVVYNGIERLSYNSDSSAGQQLASKQTENDNSGGNSPFKLIAVGNIRIAKGYDVLVRALHVLRERGTNVHIDVLGQPDSSGIYDSVVRLVEELGVGNMITFHGFVSDPAPWLDKANAFVLPSTKEGFSLSTVEAMLAGLPVIATRSGGPQEILKHEETGLLVDISNPEALAEAIERVVRDKEFASNLAKRAVTDAQARFSIETMVSAYEQLYGELLPSGGR